MLQWTKHVGIVGVAVLDAARPAGKGGWIGRWSPGIGDPTTMGWVTVLLYLAAAALCLWVARRARAEVRSERVFWYGLSGMLLLLGMNKQLDLQSAFTELGRILAADQGWYAVRHRVQRVFILVVGVIAVACAVGLLVLLRRTRHATRLAAFGATLLMAFILIRASSFHHVDLFIRAEWWDVKGNWLAELGGIAIIIAGACWGLKKAEPLAP